MYVRMLYFETSADKKAEALKIMNTMIPKIKSQPGCKDAMFLTDDADGDYALLVFWETEQQADAAAPIIGPRIIPAIDRIADEPVVPRLFKVYQPEASLV